MNKIIELHDIAEAIRITIDSKENDAYDSYRLGASQIGDQCCRKLWYGFHWAKKRKFSARIGRIFARGNLEEERHIGYLKVAGLDVKDTQKKIFAVSDHFTLRCDGVVTGVEELEGAEVLLESKTMKDSSFQQIKKKGLEKSNQTYWAQIHIMMYLLDLPYCLFIVTNKDNEELYIDLITLDSDLALKLEDKARVIIEATHPPPKIDNDPEFYLCRFCDYNDVCHKGENYARSCRTCQSVAVLIEGKWGCVEKNKHLTINEQKEGCKQYNMIKS